MGRSRPHSALFAASHSWRDQRAGLWALVGSDHRAVRPVRRGNGPAAVGADAYSLFMAVPTIDVKLLEWLRAATPEDSAQVYAAFGRNPGDGFGLGGVACEHP